MYIGYEDTSGLEDSPVSLSGPATPFVFDKTKPPVKLKLRSTDKKVNESYLKLKAMPFKFYGKRIPSNFDGRLVWGNLLPEPGFQGNCGSCWAWATVKTLAARFNIQTSGRLHVKLELSPTMPLLCDIGQLHAKTSEEFRKYNMETQKSDNLYCNGNSLEEGFGFLYRNGTVSLSCSPYNKPKDITEISASTDLPLCQDVYDKDITYCHDNENPAKIYRAMMIYKIPGVPADGGAERDLRANIFHWGPIASGFMVYPSFYEYVNNYSVYGNDYVYAQDPSSNEQPLGGHAIMIIGWGTNKDGIPFWIVQNSWGTESGDGGYFKIRRGTDECQIESNVVTCAPDIPGAPLIGESQPLETEIDKKIREQRRVNEAGYPEDIVKEWQVNGWDLDSTPLIDKKLLPDYSNFWAGEIGNVETYGKVKDTNVVVDADDRRVSDFVLKARKDYSCPLCNPLTSKPTSETSDGSVGLSTLFTNLNYRKLLTWSLIIIALLILLYLIFTNLKIEIKYK